MELPSKSDAPLPGPQHAGDGRQSGGFPSPIDAQQGDQFALADLNGDAAQGRDGSVAGMDVIQFQHAQPPASGFAQVCLEHSRDLAHFLGRALADCFTEIQHVQPMAQAHDQMHVVIDDQHAQVLLCRDGSQHLEQLHRSRLRSIRRRAHPGRGSFG